MSYKKLQPTKKKWTFKRILQHFFQGVLVLAPIFLTFYVIVWLFDTLDDVLGLSNVIPGLGVVVLLVGITAVGYLSSFFLVGRVFDVFDRLLEKTPVIKYLYTSIKDVFESLMGKKRKFEHPVLVQIYNEEVWEVGFITKDNADDFGLEDVVAVYVPMALSIAGKAYLVKKSRIRPLDHISAGDAMKFAASGGITGGREPIIGAEDGEESNEEPETMDL